MINSQNIKFIAGYLKQIIFKRLRFISNGMYNAYKLLKNMTKNNAALNCNGNVKHYLSLTGVNPMRNYKNRFMIYELGAPKYAGLKDMIN